MLNFLYPIFLKLYLGFWVLGGCKTRLGWSEPWIKLLRIGLYLKNKYSYLDSKGLRCLTWCNPLNPFSKLISQVGTWGVNVGAKLESNHYKFFMFVVLTSLYLFFIPYTCNVIIYVWIYFYWKSIFSTQIL